MRFLERTDPRLARRLLEAEGIRVESLVATEQGMDNHTFLLNDDVIVRFPKERWFRMEAERWALRAVSGVTTLPTPVVELQSMGDWPFMGYRLLPGEKLSSVWDGLSDSQREAAAKDVAGFFVELHGGVDPKEALSAGVTIESNKTRCDDLKAWEGAPEHWRPFLIECVERVERTAPAPFRFLHLDCHGDNVLWDAERERVCGIIDFGDAVVGDPHAELAIAGFIDLRILDTLIDAYVRGSGLALSRQRVWDLYVVASASDIARQTYDCTPDVEQCFQVWRAGNWPSE